MRTTREHDLITGGHQIRGSHRDPLPGAERVGDAHPDELVRVTVVLRRSGSRPDAGTAPISTNAPAEPTNAEPVEPSATGQADHADIAMVEEFAAEHGLSVTGISPAARTVGLLGSVAQMNAAFGVALGTYELSGVRPGGPSYRGREGAVVLPAELAGVVTAVLGLDNRPQARAYFRLAGTESPGGTESPASIETAGGLVPAARTPHQAVAPRANALRGYPPRQIAARYDFPTDADGTGQTVAVIELGGGYRSADLKTYFAAQGVTAPTVTAVSVDGARNTPGDEADAEVLLDIEVIGAIAPGAQLAVYFAPNTDSGFYNAIAAALHDTRRKPSVISISWGQAEPGWTAQSMDAYDALFADAATLGVTIYAAAGDGGAADGADGGTAANVDFPASSPHVVGCGGTKLTATSEVAWNETANGNGATGGGVSVHFGLPGYQQSAGVPTGPLGAPGRGVPDVAGDADPLTGYQVRVDGVDLVIGGTSAVAPLWAALTALANQLNGVPAGAPHDRFYANPGAFQDIDRGDNEGYPAGVGWDACTGLGRPVGTRIVAALSP